MKKNKGFTLVEMMVVIGLIAILLVLVLMNLSSSRMKTRDNIRVSDIYTIRLALEEYRATCGVFPATLSLSANNARNGTCSISLGDLLAEIPTAPDRPNNSLLSTAVVPSASIYNGYFYAGLSTSLNGPCYEYHIGVELEFAENNGQRASGYLSDDDDFQNYEGIYNQRCGGSTTDFGSPSPTTDDLNGLYDFRSVNNK